MRLVTLCKLLLVQGYNSFIISFLSQGNQVYLFPNHWEFVTSQAVVSIGLFLFSFMPFLYNGVNLRPSFPPPSPPPLSNFFKASRFLSCFIVTDWDAGSTQNVSLQKVVFSLKRAKKG